MPRKQSTAKQSTAGKTKHGGQQQRVKGRVWRSFCGVHMQCVSTGTEKFKERDRAVPIDFDGNWPEMNLCPTAASCMV
jgi:hypothetical protein